MIVDDNSLFRMCVGFMTRHTQHVELVGEFETGNEALKAIPLLKPDTVLVDVFMPSMDGITLIRLIRESHPDLRIIATTGSMDKHIMTGVLRAGASEIVFKEKFVAGLLKAIPQLNGNT
jgi:two-component system, NarL family, invasion response regulator UvrY